jgi:hypothetical protein
MSTKTSQLNYHGGTPSSWRRWKKKLKEETARKARRQGKKLKEDAPPKRTSGWSD